MGYCIFSIQGCGRQFSKFIFGPEKTGIPGGGTKNHPKETNFPGMTPLENLPPLAGSNRQNRSGKLVQTP